MTKTVNKRVNRISRHTRLRAKISGSAEKPRIHVYRSNQHIYVQVIDDASSKTLISVSDLSKTKKKVAKADSAKNIGQMVGEKMKELKLETAVFDRGGFKYHGRIKAVAEAIREAGIKF